MHAVYQWPTFSRAGLCCRVPILSEFTCKSLITLASALFIASKTRFIDLISAFVSMVTSRSRCTTGRVRRKWPCASSLLRPATTSRRPGNGSVRRAMSIVRLAWCTRLFESATAEWLPDVHLVGPIDGLRPYAADPDPDNERVIIRFIVAATCVLVLPTHQPALQIEKTFNYINLQQSTSFRLFSVVFVNVILERYIQRETINHF